jgi:putative membrane protein insertion efficiency factor
MAALPCYGADNNPFEPWDYNLIDKPATYEDPVSFSSRFLLNSVKFYQEYISPVRGGQCPMYPSCSAYSIQAIKKHGFFIGIMMTADRLIHESNEMDFAPPVEGEDGLRFYDPVENNDFWWYKK